jgi:hypothetical protein
MEWNFDLVGERFGETREIADFPSSRPTSPPEDFMSWHPGAMPRRIPRRPPRLPSSLVPGISHRFLPTHISRALILREKQSLEAHTPKKIPPKIVALDAVPRIPLSNNISDQARRLAQIQQIKQLYSPKEFRRLRNQQLQLVLPESPLKTVRGRIRLSILFWIYFSLAV